ncbi:CU044_2847 family protein [Lyngbya confervoides]|uniref:Trypsin-co-occurring domain-containing protein n=1 Tax=Lyngbya confervoides BDU141951 TaxID=1574623 RepID=A0ABD4T7N4_9CYAN|nr:CU044_2847 family protein [Lyngbya confervoides]MCM1984454.1 hypothetical protein [Lyngbya confervoides BDU141951]
MPEGDRTQWQEIDLPGNETAKVYLEVLNRGGRQEAGLLESIPFEQVTEILGDIAQGLGRTLERVKPKKASVELGIEFGLENGQFVALIARGTGKANLKIALEWERPDAKEPQTG